MDGQHSSKVFYAGSSPAHDTLCYYGATDSTLVYETKDIGSSPVNSTIKRNM